MIRSRSVHLRLLHSQRSPRDPEFYLRDFEQPEFKSDLDQGSLEDEREERKGTNMGITAILAISFPLGIVGMVLVVTWIMSAAGPHRTGYGHDGGERMHSREV